MYSEFAGLLTALVGVIVLVIINSMSEKSFSIMINDKIYESGNSYLMFAVLLFIIGFISHMLQRLYDWTTEPPTTS